MMNTVSGCSALNVPQHRTSVAPETVHPAQGPVDGRSLPTFFNLPRMFFLSIHIGIYRVIHLHGIRPGMAPWAGFFSVREG